MEISPGQIIYDQLDVDELFHVDTRLPVQNLSIGSFEIVGVYRDNEPQTGWQVIDGSTIPDSQVVPGGIYLNLIEAGTLRPSVATRFVPDQSGTWKFIIRYNTTYPVYTWPPKLADRQYYLTIEGVTGEAVVGGQYLLAPKGVGTLNFTITCVNPVTGELVNPDPLPVVYLYRDAVGLLALDRNVGNQGIEVMQQLSGEVGIFSAALRMTDALFERYVLLTKYSVGGRSVSRVDQLCLSDQLQAVHNSLGSGAGVGSNVRSLVYPTPEIYG